MSRITDQIDAAAQSFTSWLVGALGAGAIWTIRRMLFLSHKIALMEAEAARRDKMRDEDREVVKDIARKVDALYSRELK